MQQGVYETLITAAIEDAIQRAAKEGRLAGVESIDDDEAAGVLAEHFARILRQSLHRLDEAHGDDLRVVVYNELLELLAKRTEDASTAQDRVLQPARHLTFVRDQLSPAQVRPDTPLSIGALLTGTRLDPSLVSQLRKEFKSADAVDILCSFIKWGGVRVIEEELTEFTGKPGASLRIITTSYMGATDLKAVEFLQTLRNTTLRVSYDTHRTRLHAKAYIFHRKTGFGSAYIGSANLSQAALTDGLEWNVKVSQYEQPHLWGKATATFETYWNDAEFERYDVVDRERLDAALREERGGDQEQAIVHFDLRPYAFQQEILDKIQAERDLQQRNAHLVVAATGTGKTMIAAFDYRRWANANTTQGRRPRLLCVAHREEILKQSVARFRAVLRDHNFGDLLVGGIEPAKRDHLFVSIQSYNSREMWHVPGDYYDYVVVDEFHHAAAPSYDRLLNHVRPKVLLGLTATPERADGLDIKSYFGGHITAEVRLPDAINRKLLSPFQYFGVSDSVDLSGVRWVRGGYRLDDLNQLFTGNDIRAQLVIEKTAEKVLDIRKVRGLGFCVSVAHAEFMAEKFRRAGILAEALSADSPDVHRRTIQQRLVSREINFIFVVDLYNEGVDIPEVDTILLLRPTESLTVYLQQLGRGLRLSEGKDCLVVLDFIGQAHKSYRFDIRFRALLDDPTRNVFDEVSAGFAHLPAGCAIQLERLAKQYVLDNIGRAVRQSRDTLVDEIRETAAILGRPPRLSEFLDLNRLELDDIYRRDACWSRLCTEAGVRQAWTEADEERLTKGFRRIQHINSPRQIASLLSAVDPQAPLPVPHNVAEQRLLLMCYFSLWGRDAAISSVEQFLSRIRSSPVLCAELRDLLQLRLDQIEFEPRSVELPFPCPLELYGAYTRDEILAALGRWTLEKQPEMREGVLHLPEVKADVFMFTLHKTARDYSPTTMYEDYAVSDTLMHWQSQSTTSVESRTGQRYINHENLGQTILLCCREYKRVGTGLANPFYFLGPAEYVKHEGSRPISITWKLRHPLPAKLYRRMARLAVG